MQYPYTSQDLLPRHGTAAPEVADGNTVAPRTILVAEDDPDIRLMMGTLLGMKGYRVVESSDGQETLDVAQRERPDLILMDLQLPRLNGFAVARFIRQSDSLRLVPIVVVSAHDPAKHRNLALAAGCNAYVQKPIDFYSLDGMILNLVSSRQSAVGS